MAFLLKESVNNRAVRHLPSLASGAYYELFHAHKALTVHHEQVNLLREFFKIANAKFKVGKGTQVDVLRVQVELSKLFQHLPILEQRQETAQAHLRREGTSSLLYRQNNPSRQGGEGSLTPHL